MRTRRTSLLTLLLIALALLCIVPDVGMARPERVIQGPRGPRKSHRRIPPKATSNAPYRGPVEIRMMVIHASNDYNGFEPAIRHLQRHLNFLAFRGYKLLFESSMSLRRSATRSLGLFDGKVVEITLLESTQRQVQLKIRMYHPRSPNGVMLNTIVSVKRRGTFFVGGPRYRGGVLLLPITAWY